MPNVCIVTDSTAQFPQPNFLGQERVHILPFNIQTGSRQEDDAATRSVSVHQRLIPPSRQEFIQVYTRLGYEYDSILVLTLASLLNPTMDHALSASTQYNNHASVEVIDSQTTSIGLGMLIQIAAREASAGASLTEIKWKLSIIIPRLYMLFWIPELTYLAYSGYLSRTQALVGEILGMLPIFATEEGRLVPLEKARTPRHLFEIFQDFISEFDSPASIALVRGINHSTLRTPPLRQYVKEAFPGTPFSEHHLQPPLSTLFGPQSICLVVMETVE
ncbi:MAG: DegV family protein [Chloroflexota bacterium]